MGPRTDIASRGREGARRRGLPTRTAYRDKSISQRWRISPNCFRRIPGRKRGGSISWAGRSARRSQKGNIFAKQGSNRRHAHTTTINGNDAALITLATSSSRRSGASKREGQANWGALRNIYALGPLVITGNSNETEHTVTRSTRRTRRRRQRSGWEVHQRRKGNWNDDSSERALRGPEKRSGLSKLKLGRMARLEGILTH